MCRDFPIWCRVADRWASLHSVAQISLVCFEFLCRDRKLGKHRSLRVFFSCRVVYTCFSLFVQQIVSIRLLFCFEFGAEIQNSKFLFWNLIKELLATLRYRYIFLLSWYPIEKKTNKKTGEKKMGMGKMLSSSSLMISTYLLVLTLLYPAGYSAAKSSSSRRGGIFKNYLSFSFPSLYLLSNVVVWDRQAKD